MQLLKYLLSTGEIRGIYQGAGDTLLASQIPVADPEYGYLLSAQEILPAAQEQYAVVDGTLVAKSLVTLTADLNPFPADDDHLCLVTVEPFVPCTLRINYMTLEDLTDEDPVLELSADMPTTFTIALAWHPTVYAEPLAVIAELS